MAAKAHASRIEILTQEFSSRGMSEEAAEDLSCQLVLRQPPSQNLGIENLVREITARGIPNESAREVASLLLALELMNRGANYTTVVSQLRLQDISPSEALAGALDASRIYRESRPDEHEEDPPAFFAYLVAGITSLTVGLIALALLLQLTP